MLLALATGCLPDRPRQIRIGHIAAPTGDGASQDQSELNAIKIAIEHINAEGGLLGAPVEIIAYDSQGDKAAAIRAAKRLIEHDGVAAIIGPGQSNLASALRELANTAKTPLVVTMATSREVTVLDREQVVPYTFRICCTQPLSGAAAAQFAAQELGLHRAAILQPEKDEYAHFLSSAFKEAFEATGGRIIAAESCRSDELGCRSQLERIRNAGPDSLFILLDRRTASLAAAQAHELGIRAILLGGDGLGGLTPTDVDVSALEGAYFVSLAPLTDLAVRGFLQEFRQRFGQDALLPGALLAHDAMMLLRDAIQRANTTDGTKIRDAMEQAKGLSPLTGRLTMDPATHNPIGASAFIFQMKAGEIVAVKQFTTAD